MPSTPPSLNPSQTVERIREIIVGSHLDRLESRVSRLESAPAAGAGKSVFEPDVSEDRLLAIEARVEVLQGHARRVENARADIERTVAMYREEVQRLVSQIQEVARGNSAQSPMPEVEALERRLGGWLTDWQKSLNTHLEARDRELAEVLSSELAAITEKIESRFNQLESDVAANIDERFSRIAAAARALADSAAPSHTPAPPEE